MGNRAILKPIESRIGVYLHWNGGIDSVTAFLEYCKLKQFRPFGGEHADGYGIARFCQVVGNYFGGASSLALCVTSGTEKEAEYLDNGIYIIDGWDIVKTVGGRNKESYDLTEMLIAIDEAQPPKEQLGKDYITADEVLISEIKVGDKVFWHEGFIDDCKPELYTVESIAPPDTWCNGKVDGLPKINKYDGDNPNNYLRGINGKLRRLKPDNTTKNATYISIWDGERIETACKVNTETKEVFDIEQSNYIPDGVCEGEYIEINGQEFEVFSENLVGDNEYWRY